MKTPNYVIVHAGTIAHLQTVVNEGIAEGYAPVGGPFNASAFNPPHNTIAQAMTLLRSVDQGPETRDPKPKTQNPKPKTGARSA